MPFVEEVKNMGINQIIELLEQKLKQKLPIATKLQLALLHGTKETGIRVYELNPPRRNQSGGYHEFLNYEALTRFLNQGAVE